MRRCGQAGALRAGFSRQRAIPVDAAHGRALRDSGFRLPIPVLAAGGGRTQARGRGTEPEASLREIAADVTGPVVPDSGHLVPQEQPQALLAQVAKGGV